MGVAIVIPASKILETLYHPELVQMRKDQDRNVREANLPTTDIASNKPFTKQDFESALTKVTRKTSQK
jgi:hypothetical protein